MRPAKTIPGPPATAATRYRMQVQKRTDTRPETLLKEALTARGVVGYEADVRPLPELLLTAHRFSRSGINEIRGRLGPRRSSC